MRAFVSLSVSSNLRQQYQKLPKNLKSAIWTPDRELHITLRYLGEIDEDQLEVIKDALFDVKKQSFNVEIASLDAFYNEKSTILYANVQSKRKITDLAAKINEKVAIFGLEMPNKPYLPHVTLAKVQNRREVEAYIQKQKKHIRSQWKVTQFDLMESLSGNTEGGRYRCLQRYDLQAFS